MPTGNPPNSGRTRTDKPRPLPAGPAHRPTNEEGISNRAKAIELVLAAWRSNAERGEVSADAIKNALPSSLATAKEFIEELDQVFRHVRASASRNALEWGGKTYYEQSIGHNLKLKQEIAKKFVELIPSTPSIACSAGSTVTYCVRAINDGRKPAHIVTNNLGVVQEWRGVEEGLDLTGGTYDPDTNALSGEAVIKTFEALQCSLGLIGVSGVAPGGGLFVRHRWEARYRTAIVNTVTSDIFICADVERLASRDLWQFATIDEIVKSKPASRVILITNNVQRLRDLEKQGDANLTLNGLKAIEERLGKQRFELVVV